MHSLSIRCPAHEFRLGVDQHLAHLGDPVKARQWSWQICDRKGRGRGESFVINCIGDGANRAIHFADLVAIGLDFAILGDLK